MLKRLSRFLHPAHQHSAFSATLLLMTAIFLSRVIGYVREAYIAWAFGAGPATDAYVARIISINTLRDLDGYYFL